MTNPTTNNLPPPKILTNSGQGRQAMSDLMKSGIIVGEQLANFKAEQDTLSFDYKASSAEHRALGTQLNGAGQIATGALDVAGALKALPKLADSADLRALKAESAQVGRLLNDRTVELNVERNLPEVAPAAGGAAGAGGAAARIRNPAEIQRLEAEVNALGNRKAGLDNRISGEQQIAAQKAQHTLGFAKAGGAAAQALLQIAGASATSASEIESAGAQRIDAASRSAGSNAEQASQIVSAAGQASKADAGVIKGR